jgi:uncharacterized protein YeaO (DUF488 family)
MERRAPVVKLKRIFEPAARTDGYRVLVERLLPRGVSKHRARQDDWLQEIAPSPELRLWYRHDLNRWAEFRRRHRAELKRAEPAVERLRALSKQRTVTLVFAARDERHSGAVVLRDVLARIPGRRRRPRKEEN